MLRGSKWTNTHTQHFQSIFVVFVSFYLILCFKFAQKSLISGKLIACEWILFSLREWKIPRRDKRERASEGERVRERELKKMKEKR